jgi:hypothetical protein
MACNGAGGWVIFSQARQVNFSRTVWITFLCRGTTSSVSVMVSPSLASLPPQQGQVFGPGTTTRLRGRCAGKVACTGFLRVYAKASDRCRGGLVLGRACHRFLELQFEVEQLATALGGLPVLLAPQLGDQQLVRATSASALEARASACWRASGSAASAAFNAAMSLGRFSGSIVTGPIVLWRSSLAAIQLKDESMGRTPIKLPGEPGS